MDSLSVENDTLSEGEIDGGLGGGVGFEGRPELVEFFLVGLSDCCLSDCLFPISADH